VTDAAARRVRPTFACEFPLDLLKLSPPPTRPAGCIALSIFLQRVKMMAALETRDD
jgi:hypothetical protein